MNEIAAFIFACVVNGLIICWLSNKSYKEGYTNGRKDEFKELQLCGWINKNWHIIRPQNKNQN